MNGTEAQETLTHSLDFNDLREIKVSNTHKQRERERKKERKKERKEFFKDFIETVKDVLQNAFNSPSLPICGVGDYRHVF